MIARYSREPMARLWTREAIAERWLQVELAVTKAWAEAGVVPAESAKHLEKHARVDMKRADEIAKEVEHEVIAFLTAAGENCGEHAKWLHYGMTSSDMLDTALALGICESWEILRDNLDGLADALREKAFEHRDTICMGRTHSVYAEPTSFGLKFCSYFEELKRNRARIESAVEGLSVGTISGAVGNHAQVPIEVEESALSSLGLAPDPAPTQVVSRDRHAALLSSLALLGSSLERVTVEIRHLARTEVAEAEEPFARGQKGSSAMPHKRNPIVSERISGVARLLRSYASVGLENVPLWHERDISHSSAERVVIPDAFILADYATDRVAWIVTGLDVYIDAMKRRVEADGGRSLSGRVLTVLADRCGSREDAYAAVQGAARASRSDVDFREALEGEPLVVEHIPSSELDSLLDPYSNLSRVDATYERVFGGS
jgi:adenylosuccinate lyase